MGKNDTNRRRWARAGLLLAGALALVAPTAGCGGCGSSGDDDDDADAHVEPVPLDPTGAPTADPLEADGKTWLKIGWSEWDEEQGWGWYGEYITDTGIALYGYDDAAGYSEVERSYVYDDYGRNNLFEFALENGRYTVTVGVGRPGRGYPGDPHNATLEGVVLVDDEVTTDGEPMIVRSTEVDLADGKLSLEVGGRSESTGEWSYTFLAFVEITPVE